ncbi:MAG: hypothetical protein AAF655_15445 [Bacteroidota bacterium]
MLTVISDTSVISNFIHLNRLDILHTLYDHIYLPPSVFEEVRRLPVKSLSLSAFQEADWIIVKSPVNEELVENLLAKLDKGEAEAIVLALELNADFLLVDELLGRQEA